MIFAAIMFAVAAMLFVVAASIAFATDGTTSWLELIAAAVFAGAAYFAYQNWTRKKKADTR